MLRSQLLDEGVSMEYNTLIKKVVDDFDNADKPFPQNLMYPILVCDKSKSVSDLFMVFDLIRNEDGSIHTIGASNGMYLYNVHANKGMVIDDIDTSHWCPVQNVDLSVKTSIVEFTRLYMNVRDFAFEEKLAPGQVETLRKIVYIYDKILESKVRDIYHKYGGVFFDWAYKLLES